MKLQLTAMDSATLRGKLNRALIQIKEQRKTTVSQMRNQAKILQSQVDRVAEFEGNGRLHFGSFGAQINASIVNGVSGQVSVYDEVIELLEEVLKREKK